MKIQKKLSIIPDNANVPNLNKYEESLINWVIDPRTETKNHTTFGEISWPAYYMRLALTTALRSKDTKTRVGCVLVARDGEIISHGWNSLPSILPDTADNWANKGRVVHDFQSALTHVQDKNKLRGCTAYVTLMPCSTCAKLMLSAGISIVVYWCSRSEQKDQWRQCNKCETTCPVSFKHCSECGTYLLDLPTGVKSSCVLPIEDEYIAGSELLNNNIVLLPFMGKMKNYDRNQHLRLDFLLDELDKQISVYAKDKFRQEASRDSNYPASGSVVAPLNSVV